MGSMEERTDVASPFNDGWELQRLGSGEWTPVTLPHDAMLGEGRKKDAPSSTHMAGFLGGSYVYRKEWHVPTSLEGKVVALLFDGVFRHSRVMVNGQHVGGCISGYTMFEIRIDSQLKPGTWNLIEVHVDNSAQPAARWYTGSGIYRPVQLLVRNHDLLRYDGIRLNTLSVNGTIRVAVNILLNNPIGQEVVVSFSLSRANHKPTIWAGRTTSDELHTELEITEPDLWSAETPNLYDCMVDVSGDIYHFRYGLRTLEWASQKGLRVNGQRVLLRGACVHGDNGILGAVSFKAAELRRMTLLKKAGFNAIRMAHHPASTAMIEACDEVGLYLMDEYADYWFSAKTIHDDAASFHETWKQDVNAMIARDRNHASVIIYSLGNEPTEPATAYGLKMAKTILQYQRDIDPTRPNTMAINLMLAVTRFSQNPPGDPDTPPPSGPPLVGDVSSTLMNQLANIITPIIMMLPRQNRCDLVTRDIFSSMDIAGYNYGTDRYLKDSTAYPDRIILGTETFAPDIARNWDLVERIPNLIGDFMWTGWDYIGEAGVGSCDYNVWWWSPGRLYKAYPHLLAGSGALDIIGVQGAPVLVAQAAWKLLPEPVVAVRPLTISHQRYRTTLWRKTDAVPGWAWKGCEGKTAYIGVISQEEEVELILNGRSLGRAKGGVINNHTAKFTARYEPGELVAIGYCNGKEVSRSVVRSAGPASLKAILEKTSPLVADGYDLTYVRLEVSDEAGIVEMNDDDELEVHIEGPATLAGLGNGRLETTERFDDNVHTTYQGRALAAIRSGTRKGQVTVKVSSKRHGTAVVTIVQE